MRVLFLCSRNRLRSPTALVLSDGFLYLSDAGNARVQIYRQANLPGTSGISAEATIGPARPDQAGSDTVLSPVGVHTFKSGAEGYLLVTDQGSGARKSAVLVYRLY